MSTPNPVVKPFSSVCGVERVDDATAGIKGAVLGFEDDEVVLDQNALCATDDRPQSSRFVAGSRRSPDDNKRRV